MARSPSSGARSAPPPPPHLPGPRALLCPVCACPHTTAPMATPLASTRHTDARSCNQPIPVGRSNTTTPTTHSMPPLPHSSPARSPRCLCAYFLPCTFTPFFCGGRWRPPRPHRTPIANATHHHTAMFVVRAPSVSWSPTLRCFGLCIYKFFQHIFGNNSSLYYTKPPGPASRVSVSTGFTSTMSAMSCTTSLRANTSYRCSLLRISPGSVQRSPTMCCSIATPRTPARSPLPHRHLSCAPLEPLPVWAHLYPEAVDWPVLDLWDVLNPILGFSFLYTIFGDPSITTGALQAFDLRVCNRLRFHVRFQHIPASCCGGVHAVLLAWL